MYLLPNTHFLRIQLMEYTILELEENFMQSLSAFLILFWWQKIAFKSPLDLCFYLFIIKFFLIIKIIKLNDLPCGIKAVISLMCLEVLGKVFFCFPVRDWEGFCRKLLALVKLYQRFWMWNIDQNLNIPLLIVAICTVLF